MLFSVKFSYKFVMNKMQSKDASYLYSE